MIHSQFQMDLFTNPPMLVAQRNRGKENDKIFQEHKLKFHSQACQIMRHLVEGHPVNSVIAKDLFQCVDARPRFAKLKSIGFKMQKRTLANGLIERYCTGEQIIYNKEKFKEYLETGEIKMVKRKWGI